MIAEFSVKNYYSIKEEITLSMVASKDKEYIKNTTKILEDKEIRLLKTVVIYGANGSGKSNLFKAMRFFKYFIRNSSKNYTVGDEIPINAFKFNTKTINQPSMFEIIYFSNNKRYRYGFEASKEKVVSEWLYIMYTNRESKIFYREDKKPIEFGDKISGTKRYINEQKTVRENALLLSVMVQNGDEGEAKEVAKYINNITIISGLRGYTGSKTVELLNTQQYQKEKENIIEIMKSVSFGLDNLSLDISKVEEEALKSLLENLPEKQRKRINESLIKSEKKGYLEKISVNTEHKVFNEQKEFVGYESLDFRYESDGTKRFFELLGPVIDAIKNGKVLLVDEIESSLHLYLLETIIKMFHYDYQNPTSQLIFTTHCIPLLSSELFRRDQIWLMEKNIYGASSIKSLVEFKIRKDLSFEKNYRLGKFGAIPFIKELELYGDIDEQ